MTPELWKAKKIVDSTIHPGAWTPLFPYLPLSSWENIASARLWKGNK